ncbi:MAG: PDZ domain-containing protein [Phycisphaerales bacterium]|nr:PDZ domain-containing protein [Phycisphaerales bacterium]
MTRHDTGAGGAVVPHAAAAILTGLTFLPATFAADAPSGYYRQPAIRGGVIVFASEGDLWRVSVEGGAARRLTTHPDDETFPAISADGRTVAFVGRYEGPAEVYTMSIEGGLPERWTYSADSRVMVSNWTDDGHLLYATRIYSTLPSHQLTSLDPESGTASLIPLAQAADGCYDDRGRLFFTRLPNQGSRTKRYAGGSAENLWRFDGEGEAVALTGDYAGTSRDPMWWNGRLYFSTDRDGTMNIWSMKGDGSDLRQHTEHVGFDVLGPDLSEGRIVYQLGADLYLYDIRADRSTRLDIDLDSDFDDLRERWIDDPASYVTSAHPSFDGSKVALTARGDVFVVPRKRGRLVEVTRDPDVRQREARFLPEGDTLVTLSDASGEVELWTFPANGIGEASQLTDDGTILRWETLPSPDGRWIAHHDKSRRLALFDTETGTNRVIASTREGGGEYEGLAWSGDSRWLAFVQPRSTGFGQVMVCDTRDASLHAVTSERSNAHSPAWSPDGQWLWFIADRNLQTAVGGPWGLYQPEPFIHARAEIFGVALTADAAWPFREPTELDDARAEEDGDDDAPDSDADAGADEAVADDAQVASEDAEAGDDDGDKDEATPVEIDFEGLMWRQHRVPVPAGNYFALMATDKRLLWLSTPAVEWGLSLQAAALSNDKLPPEVETLVEGLNSVEMTGDGKSLLLGRRGQWYVVDANAGGMKLEDDARLDLSGWMFSVDPRTEWRQIFVEAWRLERDYLYDPDMHGVDWEAMLQKYLPLVDRVSTRDELADVIAQMVAELSALHIFVYGGDHPDGEDNIAVGFLGAACRRDPGADGWRVERIYRNEPDDPAGRSPLAAPGVDVQEGDIITRINGRPTLEARDLGQMLRNQVERQVLLDVRDGDSGATRQVIVHPISAGEFLDLRYDDWEYSRRLLVEEWGAGDIGYVHLRAMGDDNYEEWARNFYPVFNRKGLVLDVRHNRGGNIDSWILEKLMRKAWFYWQYREGEPSWNMQYAFRGHLVVLCDELTASDGEAVTEGVRRLELGTVMGTRTWGGEVWLSSSNFLVDRGIATAAEFGVFGPEGEWLIEGHGVEPDIEVDNPPHATFNGEDAQLRAAIDFLQRRIEEEPVEDIVVPPLPDKSSPDNRGR